MNSGKKEQELVLERMSSAVQALNDDELIDMMLQPATSLNCVLKLAARRVKLIYVVQATSSDGNLS